MNGADGQDVIIAPALTDLAEMDRLFPKGHRAFKGDLRVTPRPNK